MASPQKEDGYTAIANEIMDALCRIRIPGEERQVLDSILRKTYGWNKCEDAIALSQFVESTGLSKPHIVHAINGLLLKKVIIVAEKGNDKAKVYKINKNYESWEPLPKKVTLPKKEMGVAEKGNASLPKKGTTKDTNTKDTLTKDKYTSKPSVSTCPHQEIISLYHEILPELPAVKLWTPQRQAILRQRWTEDPDRQCVEWWREYFEKVRDSPFLMGREKDFRADLEWIIRPKNMPKIIEGRYAKRNGNGKLDDILENAMRQ